MVVVLGRPLFQNGKTNSIVENALAEATFDGCFHVQHAVRKGDTVGDLGRLHPLIGHSDPSES